MQMERRLSTTTHIQADIFFYTNHPKIIELPTTELRWMHSQVDKIAH